MAGTPGEPGGPAGGDTARGACVYAATSAIKAVPCRGRLESYGMTIDLPRQADDLLMVAVREPTAGFTKTRLGAAIGMARAAALYRAFLADLACRLTPSRTGDGDGRPYDLAWAYTPAGCAFAAVLAGLDPPAPEGPVRFVAQAGEGWGARQANLLRWGHDAGYARTVLVASDSPHLPRGTVLAAHAALREHDIALGRVLDGGYYLIGVRGDQDVLTGVPMSTADAADAVCARAGALGLRVAEMPTLFDVDEAADLDHLRAALAPDGAPAPATWRALAALGLCGGSVEQPGGTEPGDTTPFETAPGAIVAATPPMADALAVTPAHAARPLGPTGERSG